MCLAIPGKVIEIKENEIIIDYGAERRKASLSLEEIAVGDYVIIKGGVIIAKVNKEAAEGLLEELKNAGENG